MLGLLSRLFPEVDGTSDCTRLCATRLLQTSTTYEPSLLQPNGCPCSAFFAAIVSSQQPYMSLAVCLYDLQSAVRSAILGISIMRSSDASHIISFQ